MPILVTELPIVTLVKPVQPLNELEPILVTPLGSMIFVRFEQFANALAVILVMVEPIVTLAKLERAHTGTAPA